MSAPRATTSRPVSWLTLAAAALLLLLVAEIAARNLNPSSPDHLRVLGSFWASGWASAHGNNPYAIWPLTWVWHPFVNQPITVVDRNLSPPALLPLFSGISHWPAERLVTPWTLLSALLLSGLAALLLLHRRGQLQSRQILWLLLAPATLDTLFLGQDYALFAFAAAAGFVLLDRDHDLMAGVCIGFLAAAKFNFGIWILLLLFTRRWRAAATAAAVSSALSAIPIVLYGRRIYVEWFQAVRADTHASLPTDVSLAGFFARLGCPHVGLAVSGVLGLAVLIYAGRRGARCRETTGIALCAALLCSPLAWVHYTVILAAPLLARRWSARFTAAMVPLFLPFGTAFISWEAVRNAWNSGAAFNLLASCCYCLPVCAMLIHFVLQDLRGDGVDVPLPLRAAPRTAVRGPVAHPSSL